MCVHIEKVGGNNTEHTNIRGDNKRVEHSECDLRLVYKILVDEACIP